MSAFSLPLETPRLILRRLAPADAPALSAYRSDPEVARYQGWQAPYSLEQAHELIAEMQSITPGEPGCWLQIAFALKTTGELIGDCAFKRLIGDPRQAELGITLAQAYQGQGYAAEGLTCLINHLFDTFNLHRLCANIDPQNAASANLLRRLGFRHEATHIESLWLNGAYMDEAWYAILRREWLLAHNGG